MNVREGIQLSLNALFPESVTPEQTATEGGDGQGESVVSLDSGKHGGHLDVSCLPEQVVAVAQLMDDQGFFLESIAGVDWLEKQQLEVIYDYNRLGGEHCRVMVRTRVPRNAPEVPTITGIFPAADWHERETFDFYGIQFKGHPHLIRILLPEDADFHPLLKDYMP